MTTVATKDLNLYPARKIYDTADAAFQDGNANTGLTARMPMVVSLEGMSAGTFMVQVRVSESSSWLDYQEIPGTDVTAVVEFTFTPYNFVRVIRTVGTDPCVAYVQNGPFSSLK